MGANDDKLGSKPPIRSGSRSVPCSCGQQLGGVKTVRPPLTIDVLSYDCEAMTFQLNNLSSPQD
jgi:hypothetical protein